jgi:hypothetical protein
MKFFLCFCFALILSGCDELAQRQKAAEHRASTATPPQSAAQTVRSETARFVFPPKATPFPDASVALDTATGRLCKTYAWQDNASLPKGLPLCSESLVPTSLTGASKAYGGFTYTFNGAKWVKGQKALRFNEKSQEEPWSEDQYDPLNLFSKEEKAKRTLTAEDIQRVASQFGVSYGEAAAEAKQHGYQVSSKH